MSSDLELAVFEVMVEQAWKSNAAAFESGQLPEYELLNFCAVRQVLFSSVPV